MALLIGFIYCLYSLALFIRFGGYTHWIYLLALFIGFIYSLTLFIRFGCFIYLPYRWTLIFTHAPYQVHTTLTLYQTA